MNLSRHNLAASIKESSQHSKQRKTNVKHDYIGHERHVHQTKYRERKRNTYYCIAIMLLEYFRWRNRSTNRSSSKGYEDTACIN
mmetsp:Transcript_7929/g.10452  ORF Transcript_7929/g.10452 Transcript_7929/m.10452 type:complete len:84 (+) Transcript_7929:958-1209(+)